MSTTFFLADERNAEPTSALATARQVAQFRDWLRGEGVRLGIDLLPEFDGRAPNFEIRVCPLAIASIAAHFDHDEHVVATVEQAQFLGRCCRFTTCLDGLIELTLSSRLDSDSDLNVTSATGYDLLEALGLDPASAGEVDRNELRFRLMEPVVRRRLQDRGMLDYATQLATIVRTGEQHELTRVLWT